MHTMTKSDEQVLTLLNNLDTRVLPHVAAFRSIADAEVEERRRKTERLRAARIDASQANH